MLDEPRRLRTAAGPVVQLVPVVAEDVRRPAHAAAGPSSSSSYCSGACDHRDQPQPLETALLPLDLRVCCSCVRRSCREPTTYTCQLLSCMFPLDAGDSARLPAAPPADARAADRAGAGGPLRGLGADDPPGRRVARGGRRPGRGGARACGRLPPGGRVPDEADRPDGRRGGGALRRARPRPPSSASAACSPTPGSRCSRRFPPSCRSAPAARSVTSTSTPAAGSAPRTRCLTCRRSPSATWREQRLSARYREGPRVVRRTLDPLGLVLKGGAWYLVARRSAGMRVYRVSRFVSVRVRDEGFERPEGFELDSVLGGVVAHVRGLAAARRGQAARERARPPPSAARPAGRGRRLHRRLRESRGGVPRAAEVRPRRGGARAARAARTNRRDRAARSRICTPSATVR